MQLLIFNTKEKTTKVKSDFNGSIISDFSFDKISTVYIRDGYYELMQKKSDKITVPVARLPISNTNMLIVNE